MLRQKECFIDHTLLVINIKRLNCMQLVASHIYLRPPCHRRGHVCFFSFFSRCALPRTSQATVQRHTAAGARGVLLPFCLLSAGAADSAASRQSQSDRLAPRRTTVTVGHWTRGASPIST